MAIYNGEKYLKEAIDSILGQTYTNFEFIIVNDGSTDSSRDIISSYKDKRILLIDNEYNMGLIKSLNKGLNYARGKYLARMDADDISLPKRFEEQLKIMRDFEVDVCGTGMQLINKEGKYIGRLGPTSIVYSDIPASILNNSTWLLHPTIMMKSSVLQKVGGYNPRAWHVEDSDLWARLLIEKNKLIVVPEKLVKYRKHDEQICERFSDIQTKNDRIVVYDYIASLIGDRDRVKVEALAYFFLMPQGEFLKKERLFIRIKDIFNFRKLFRNKFSYINNSLIGLDKRIANSALHLIKDSHYSSLKLRSEMMFMYLFANLSVYHHQGLLIKEIFLTFYKAVRRLYKFVKTKYHGGAIA